MNNETTKEIKEFLEKFFSLYPFADEKELSYYVKNDALSFIDDHFVFVELVDIVCTKVDDQITASVKVKYKDERVGVDQISDFVLGLEKEENWFISSNGKQQEVTS